MARIFHPAAGMPIRRLFRALALVAAPLVAAAALRPAPMAPAASAGACEERGSCPRCPASSRRAPESCGSCTPSVDGVAQRKVRLAAPAPRLRETRPASAGVRFAHAVRGRVAARRHEVLGASPPRQPLLAVFRN